MRTILYYEALGETKKVLLGMMEERVRAKSQMYKWSAAHGGDKKRIGIVDDAFGFRWSLYCSIGKTPDNPEHWKRCKNNRQFWNPRLSTKEGKKLEAEMRALSEKIPSVGKMMDILGVPHIDGLYVMSIGLQEVGGRLLIQIPGRGYKPPKGVRLKRISDLEFDKLTRRRRSDNDEE